MKIFYYEAPKLTDLGMFILYTVYKFQVTCCLSVRLSDLLADYMVSWSAAWVDY